MSQGQSRGQGQCPGEAYCPGHRHYRGQGHGECEGSTAASAKSGGDTCWRSANQRSQLSDVITASQSASSEAWRHRDKRLYWTWLATVQSQMSVMVTDLWTMAKRSQDVTKWHLLEATASSAGINDRWYVRTALVWNWSYRIATRRNAISSLSSSSSSSSSSRISSSYCNIIWNINSPVVWTSAIKKHLRALVSKDRQHSLVRRCRIISKPRYNVWRNLENTIFESLSRPTRVSKPRYLAFTPSANIYH